MSIPELERLEIGLPSVAGEFECSIGDFYRRCLVLLDEEQRKLSPDNAIIAVLCDAVRFTREHVYLVNEHLSRPPAAPTEER